MTGERRHAARVSVVLLAAIWVVAMDVAVAWAASPTPTSVGGGDPRSSGQGPGLLGDPVTAILLVLAIAAASVLATGLWVRVTRPGRGGPRV